MYRIAVCDDNPEILTQVCPTLSGSPLGKELELTPFHSGAALAAALRSGARFALLILDIELEETTHMLDEVTITSGRIQNVKSTH